MFLRSIFSSLGKVKKNTLFDANNFHFHFLTKNLCSGLLKQINMENSLNLRLHNNNMFNTQNYKKFFSSNVSEKNKKDANDKNNEEVNPEDKKIKREVENENTSSSSENSDEDYENPKERELYANLEELYREQNDKLEFAKDKFIDLKAAYIQKKTELVNLKARSEKEIETNKDYAITKFVKDLLDVSDNFDRASDSVKEIDYSKLTDEEKIKTFKDLAEGN